MQACYIAAKALNNIKHGHWQIYRGSVLQATSLFSSGYKNRQSRRQPKRLSSLYALVKLDYKNITVLEKYHTVGGMCESVDIEGSCKIRRVGFHKFALIETTGKFQDMK
ncbi:hypothetical protein IFM89_029106 [Coptis chinensis]|uniref:Uncharacterized protein n=1 Tax=Coptis chinensis TaxID=261450 RepID=A0A835M287_9MAGN|nr:hypothetical protein IFM89_029106 [Coptis chinensis]